MTKWGSYRASDADREEIVGRLHKAATEGRIAAEELEQRVSVALKARTYDELHATVADLPDPDANARSRRRGPARGPVPARQAAGRWAVSAVRANPVLLLFALPVLAVTVAMVIAVTVIWAVLMIVLLVVGGGHRHRRRAGPPPWAYTWRGRWAPPAPGPQRRRPRDYWA